MAQFVASMSGVVQGGVAKVVGSSLIRGKIFTASMGSSLIRGKIFTASIGSVDLL